MIGIALVTFVSVLAQGLRVSNSDAIERQIQADLIVTSQDGYSEFPAAVGDAVAESTAPRPSATSARTSREIDGDGAQPDRPRRSTINEVYDFRWDGGLGRGARAARRRRRRAAEQRRRGQGPRRRRLVHGAHAGQRAKEFVVRGIYEGSPFYPLLGTASISQDGVRRALRAAAQPLHAPQRPRRAGAAAKASVESALEDFPDTRVQTRPEWIDKEDAEIQQFLLLLYVLLALSVIISLFGMVNTLALSVFERTRELGMLRAVGMTRRQTRRMIRHESVITALIGAALGLPLGIFLALLVTQALSASTTSSSRSPAAR